MEKAMNQPGHHWANSCPLTPLTFLERASLVYGECTSIVYNKTTYTWSDTYSRCLILASAIVSLGIKPGQVVSVVAPNIPAMYELQFAVPMSGAVLNNINTRLDSRTVSVILQHAETKLVFVDCYLKSLVLQALDLFSPDQQTPMLILIEEEEEEEDILDHHRHESSSRLLTRGMFLDTYEGLVKKYKNKKQQGGGEGGNREEHMKWKWTSEWEPMTLNYTSGTTSSSSSPKGVLHSHRSLFIISFDSLINWSVPNQPVYLWTLPIFHSNGWSYAWGMAAVGATNICLRKFDAAAIYAAINIHGVTHMCGAPVVLNMLANYYYCYTTTNNNNNNNYQQQPPLVKIKHRPVHFLTGGSPPPPSVLYRTESLGFLVSHGYGLTEVAGVVVSCAWKPKWNLLPDMVKAKLKARQGVRVLGLTEVDVVDPKTGVSVKRDGLTMGEIVLRGACVMLGYYKNPEGTSKCMRDNGWLYTGDVGVIHQDGYLEIKDRSKDIIISGGENVSSVEVESVLYSIPAVNEAAVVSLPDDYWGETPCAFLSLKGKQTVSEKEIMEFCRARLPHFMVPKTVVFLHELPKTSTGKIQKFKLRNMAKTIGVSRPPAAAPASKL